MKLICCVIASPSEVYDAYKKQWIELIQRVKKIEIATLVDFYFIYNGSNEFIKTEYETHTDLQFPHEETVIPGILLKTMDFYKYILAEKIPFTHMLRANLSSFYRFDKLCDVIKKHTQPKWILSHFNIGDYPTGCGAVFTKDLIEYISTANVDYASEKYDDEIFGQIVRRTITHRYEYDYVNLCDATPEKAQELMKQNHFHYRTKNPNINPGMSGVENFKQLINMYYQTM